jgi:CheY-like chemotaxis protein
MRNFKKLGMEKNIPSLDGIWIEHGYGTRFQGFQNLMRKRIRDIILVSSLYDLYLFEEDGRLYELIRNEYQGLNLSHSPELIRVSSGMDAIALAQEEKRYDLIITTLHIEDMTAAELARLVKEKKLNIPVILLSHDNRELQMLLKSSEANLFDKIFVWLGDYRIIIAIIKFLEDKMNLDHDTSLVGVQNIIVIEDNIKDYSAFLPIIYTELLQQSQRLISEGINLTHKFLRMRARPKILLCSTFEEAWNYYKKYNEYVLGVISDIEFPRNGQLDSKAGIIFAEKVKSNHPDIPIVLLSNDTEIEQEVKQVGASFILKNSPTLLIELRYFMNHYFSFGDFIFRTPDGYEVGRASDLNSMIEVLKTIPEESIRYHAERNHFSNWLKARTEFWLAHQLRPRKVSDYPNIEALRQDLIQSIQNYIHLRQRGIITDFKKDTFDPESTFARIGGGSLGGKARGLGFVNTLINYYNVREKFENVRIYVPSAVVLGTDVFDQFLDENNLRKFALNCDDDEEITKRFLLAEKFPEDVIGQLIAFLELIKTPLAIRSSSLLEDSQYHPFAGVYETYMIPNQNQNILIRLNELLSSVKIVYASTFYRSAKEYIKMTHYRLEEEKMAVIIQRMVGKRHQNRFYPHFSGVARSYNFYPIPPQKSTDGIVSIAIGLGKWVVDGGNTIKFCPRYPKDVIQFHSIKETLDSTQREFYALQLDAPSDFGYATHDLLVKRFGLKEAEEDGVLSYVGSTYSAENNVIADGISREGLRIITFQPIFKHNLIPIPQILELLLDMGTWGMGTHIEIEFAINIDMNSDFHEFGILQMRPLVVSREFEELVLNGFKEEQILCKSNQVLGHGKISDIKDIIFVDYQKFDRSKSVEVAKEIYQFNRKMIDEKKPYLLIGVGRWGSIDPWLGIPVNWDGISGAKVIVESNFRDFNVEPSQGSHFFQNITAFQIGYFTVNNKSKDNFIDWSWLYSQPISEAKEFSYHISLDKPITVIINGHRNEGLILKPE